MSLLGSLFEGFVETAVETGKTWYETPKETRQRHAEEKYLMSQYLPLSEEELKEAFKKASPEERRAIKRAGKKRGYW